MPLKISELQSGDRVILNCPTARLRPKREAVFEEVHAFDQTICACFLMQTVEDKIATVELRALFLVDPDGSTLRDDEGRRIYIEQRVFVGRG